MNVLKKYTWLVGTLMRAGDKGLTLEQIGDRWNATEELHEEGAFARRSFHRHRSEIMDLFGIEIECYVDGGQYRYRLTDNRRGGGSRYSESESKDKNGIKQGLVHELGTILSMAAAVLVLYLVMRVFHGFTDAQYDKVVVGIVMLVLVSAVFSVCRLIFFAVKMAAKLPVIRLVDSILGSVGGLAEGLIVLYVVETISRYFIDLQLNLVTRGVPVVYNFAMQLL